MFTKRILIGTKDLNYLHENWPKGQFIHITKVAEILQKAQVDGTLGLKPYDCRRKYEKYDKIVVLMRIENELVEEEVEIYEIEQGYDDEEGEYYEKLRTKPIGSKTKKGRTFRSNYKGNSIRASTTVTPDEFAVSKSHELIPELIIKLKGDRRVVSFEDHWSLKKDIEEKKISKFDQSFYSLLTRKTDFETGDLVEQSDENSLITSNYLLSRFQYLSKRETKSLNYFWSCPQKVSVKLFNYHLDVKNNRIKIDNSLEAFLAYNCLTQQTVFKETVGKRISVKINLLSKVIESKVLFQTIIQTIHNNKVVRLSSRGRGSEILISAIDVNVEWSITLKQNWINSDTLKINRRISKYLTGFEDIDCRYDEDRNVKLFWDSNRDELNGLNNWYREKGIRANDKIHLKLFSLYPPKLRIWTEHETDIDLILEPKSEDNKWDKFGNRQCIYWILKREDREFHYREIYNEVKKHKDVSIKTILSELCHNSPQLFRHSRYGFWHISETESDKKKKGRTGKKISKSGSKVSSLTSEVWDFVVDIEQRDLVHEILEITKNPLSFHEICAKILRFSGNKNISLNELKETGFLNKSDERLERFKSGEWGLTKWLWRDLLEKEVQLDSAFKSISDRLSTILN